MSLDVREQKRTLERGTLISFDEVQEGMTVTILKKDGTMCSGVVINRDELVNSEHKFLILQSHGAFFEKDIKIITFIAQTYV